MFSLKLKGNYVLKRHMLTHIFNINSSGRRGGLRDQIVKVVYFKPLALTAVGSNPDRDFGFFM
jgi:hypothetical protein